MSNARTITTKDGITVRPLTPGKWEARDAQGHWLADGRTAKAALGRARDNLSSAGLPTI